MARTRYPHFHSLLLTSNLWSYDSKKETGYVGLAMWTPSYNPFSAPITFAA